jgi:hypothetical protein
MRDCAYKIRMEAEREMKVHRRRREPAAGEAAGG